MTTTTKPIALGCLNKVRFTSARHVLPPVVCFAKTQKDVAASLAGSAGEHDPSRHSQEYMAASRGSRIRVRNQV
jgi:hypothetical protein